MPISLKRKWTPCQFKRFTISNYKISFYATKEHINYRPIRPKNNSSICTVCIEFNEVIYRHSPVPPFWISSKNWSYSALRSPTTSTSICFSSRMQKMTQRCFLSFLISSYVVLQTSETVTPDAQKKKSREKKNLVNISLVLTVFSKDGFSKYLIKLESQSI